MGDGKKGLSHEGTFFGLFDFNDLLARSNFFLTFHAESGRVHVPRGLLQNAAINVDVYSGASETARTFGTVMQA